MILVKRERFIAWVSGDLMERDSTGVVLVTDDIAYEAAIDAMDNGEAIGLTVDGKLFSKMKLSGEDEYMEFRDSECVPIPEKN